MIALDEKNLKKKER